MDKFYEGEDYYIYIETADVTEASKLITEEFEESSDNDISQFLTKIILPNICVVDAHLIFEVLVDRYNNSSWR